MTMTDVVSAGLADFRSEKTNKNQDNCRQIANEPVGSANNMANQKELVGREYTRLAQELPLWP